MLSLLVGRNHEIVVSQRLSLPLSFIEIEDPSCLGGELRVAWEDPTAVLPGANGILVQPAPQRGLTQPGNQAAVADVPAQLVEAPA
jgi:hypothetical protein